MIEGLADEERVVRVFISSTFLEFQEERQALVNNVFPRLREHFDPLGITVVGIDLRWGIAEDTVREVGDFGSVLKLGGRTPHVRIAR